MLDFDNELKKFSPILELENMEQNLDELKDILDMFEYIKKTDEKE